MGPCNSTSNKIAKQRTATTHEDTHSSSRNKNVIGPQILNKMENKAAVHIDRLSPYTKYDG
jgi:hypothetical protein